MLVAVAVVLAVVAPGAARKVYALDDGGVWVTNHSVSMLGRLNYPSQVLDGGVTAAGADFDVLQQGADVVLLDPSRGTIAAVDPSTVTARTGATVPGDAITMLGGEDLGGEVAVFSKTSGRVWMTSFSTVGTLRTTSGTAVRGTGHVIAAAMSVAGNLYTVDATGRLLRTAPGSTPSAVGALSGIGTSAALDMTVIGETPVVSEPSTGALWLGTVSSKAVDTKVRLQEPSADAADVLYATGTHLVAQPLDGSAPRSAKASDKAGTATAPVVVSGCAYGAWSGTAMLVRWCDPASATSQPVAKPIPDLTGTVVFRVNRSRVVLNDPASGAMWLVDAGLHEVSDWSAFKQKTTEKTDKTTKTQRTVEQTAVALPPRTAKDTPPKAEDDHLGVRAGATEVLHVLDNDTDADGDVLTASPNGDPTFGHVTAVDGGAALQIDVPQSAGGSGSFEYTVSDGRGGTDTARVDLHVVPAAEHSMPVQLSVPTVSVEEGATVTFSALDSWRDPDGDALQVTGVVATNHDSATSTPDGVVTYVAAGGGTGEHELTVLVSNGHETAKGTVDVVVRAPGTATPVANNDRATATVGETITVSPLANDIDPTSSPLRLVKAVLRGTGAQIVPDFDDGTFTFTASRAGNFYVQYLVAAGARSATGLVRVDVDAAATKRRPIAMQDTAYLPAGGQVTVDPLANDIDPTGGVLVVESISIPTAAQASVALVGHSLVRLTDTSGAPTAFQIGYVVANSAGTSNGVIRVVPTPAAAKALPPVGVADQATVRAGDVVSIDVLANDVSPSGSRLYVQPALVEAPATSAGKAYVSGARVLFQASSRAGTATLSYGVTDTDPSTGQVGLSGSATVSIRIVAKGGADQPPRPQPLTARVLEKQSVLIPVPLDGIDPDGDSVQLVGIGGPRLGKVAFANGGIRYTAPSATSGTDEFTYEVQDRLGATASSTVRVGVVPPATQDQLPRAIPDTVRTRPGRQVAVDVLANDIDPDGDPITLTGASGKGDDASLSGGRVLVRVPETPGTTAVRYTISDGRGGSATGSLTVISDPKAPLLAPIARDFDVSPLQVANERTVSVPVLQNDDDPDGVASALIPSVVSGAATVRGKQVVLTVRSAPQVIVYRVTDVDHLTATAVVRVPGLAQLPPTLRVPTPVVEVVAGRSRTIDLQQFIRVRSGRSFKVARAAGILAPGAASVSLASNGTDIDYVAAKDQYGQYAVSVEVTDAKSAKDATGLTSTISIPIRVLPAGPIAPTFTGGTIDVAKGEPAARFDLRAASTDLNSGGVARLTFTVPSIPAFTATVVGGQLQVTTTAAEGTDGTLHVTVHDGSLTTQGVLTVKSIGSLRPPPSAVTDVVSDARAGQAISVHVLNNDYNPFAAQHEPLRLLSATAINPPAASVVRSGDVVRITPPKGFVGTLVAQYIITDATGATDREAQGKILVTVQGVPDAPGVPTVAASQSGQVTLTWIGGADNGAPITKYTVSPEHGAPTTCPATTCTITGLTNGSEYVFTVTATNAVGTSAPSAPSSPVTPDTRPDPPTLTSIDYGDQTLSVKWQNGQNLGSALTGYVLTVSPGQTYTIPAGQSSYTIPGLANGAQYAISLQAQNKDGTSDPSNTLTDSPAGQPGTVSAPTVSTASSVGSQSQVQVSWNAASPNAEALTGYLVRATQGGAVVSSQPVGANQLTTNLTLPHSDSDFEVSVAAENKATDQGRLQLSYGPATSYHSDGAPAAPADVSATAADGAIGLAWTWAADDRNGVPQADISYQYLLNDTGSWRTISTSGGPTSYSATVSSGVTNGTAYTVRIRAVGDGLTGDPSASSNSVTPYGKPSAPLLTVTPGDTNVTFSWAPGANNGRDITKMMVSVDGATATPQSVNGQVTVGSGHSESHRIAVYAVDSAGQNSETANAQGTSAAAPQPTYWVTRSGDDLTYHWQDVPTGMWPQVTDFRCWMYQHGTQPGGFAQDGCGDVGGYNGFPSGTGSVTIHAPGATDSYSIEPWKYGPWLNVGETSHG